MRLNKSIYISFFIAGIIASCKAPEGEKKETLFQKIESSASGVTFRNDLPFDEKFNIFTYRNFYNGGGVAMGDVNNDGLIDLYLTSNLGENKLYLNEGDFKFKDITATAGVAGTRAWSTGVAMADVNGDGLLDIYVCNSGDIAGDNKQNELFINNGDGTFSEKAEAFGLADQGYSTHAVFFGYDNDGTLTSICSTTVINPSAASTRCKMKDRKEILLEEINCSEMTGKNLPMCLSLQGFMEV